MTGKQASERNIGSAAETKQAAEKIEHLRDQIRRHDHLYYIEASPGDLRPRLRPAAATSSAIWSSSTRS